MEYVNEFFAMLVIQTHHARHEKVISAESVFVYTPTCAEEVSQLYVILGHRLPLPE
jgi:hypothetical protein